MTTTIDHPPSRATPESPAQLGDAGPTLEDLRALEERLEQRAIRRDGWTLSIFALAAIAVVFSIVGIGFGLRAIDESKRNARAAAPPAPSAVAPAAASPGPVTLSDFQVRPASTTVAAGNVTFQISNQGNVAHELLVFRSDLAPAAYPMKDGNINEEGPGITQVSDGENLDPGASQARSVDLTQPGTYLLVCNLPGHFKAGMYSVITVK